MSLPRSLCRFVIGFTFDEIPPLATIQSSREWRRRLTRRADAVQLAEGFAPSFLRREADRFGIEISERSVKALQAAVGRRMIGAYWSGMTVALVLVTVMHWSSARLLSITTRRKARDVAARGLALRGRLRSSAAVLQ